MEPRGGEGDHEGVSLETPPPFQEARRSDGRTEELLFTGQQLCRSQQ